MENKKIGTLSSRDTNAIYEDYEKHQHDGDIIEKYGTILVLDVLGWKNKASRSEEHTSELQSPA